MVCFQEHIFCGIGGKSIQKVVSGIMKRIFSKELAAKVNWNGHNEKIRFEISNLCKVVIGKVMLRYIYPMSIINNKSSQG